MFIINYIKRWFLANMFEVSTWIGLAFLILEIIRRDTSTIAITLSIILLVVPDTKLRQFMLKHVDGLKKFIDGK